LSPVGSISVSEMTPQRRIGKFQKPNGGPRRLIADDPTEATRSGVGAATKGDDTTGTRADQTESSPTNASFEMVRMAWAADLAQRKTDRPTTTPPSVAVRALSIV